MKRTLLQILTALFLALVCSTSARPQLAEAASAGILPPAGSGYDSRSQVSGFVIQTSGAALQARGAALQAPIIPDSWAQAFARDRTGNTLAVIVLIGMIVTVIGVAYSFVNVPPTERGDLLPSRWIPVLCLLGLGVALYLSYVEVSEANAICGPVGNCNAVQRSPYARLFGIIPVGLFGAVGYIGMLAAWWVQRTGPDHMRRLAALALWGMAWFGILYSIYLTFLEPFVIGATCMWCLSSAIIMTLMLWITTDSAKRALHTGEDMLLEEG